jgi:hypothetical protein
VKKKLPKQWKGQEKVHEARRRGMRHEKVMMAPQQRRVLEW